MPVDGPLTTAERLFVAAGYTRLQFLAWRVGTLPLLEAKAAFRAFSSGWPAEVLAEHRSEATLARRWIEEQLQKRGKEERYELASAQSDGHTYANPMSSGEAIQLLQSEKEELGKHHSIGAFKKALTHAASKAREDPDRLPLPLGGQHSDWQLVSLGTGGHRGGHKVRRRLPKTESVTNDMTR